MFPVSSHNKRAIVIREAVRADLEAIGDLWVELMSYHQGLDERFGVPSQGRANYIRHTYTAIRDQSYKVLVAIDDGYVIGYVIGYIAQNPPIFIQPVYGFIADLCVTAMTRRQGAGRLLVEHICRWFRQRGMKSIQLNVAHHNLVSQSFWRKMGCTDYLDHMWLDIRVEQDLA